MRLYLPEAWAEDQERRASVGVPQEVEFQTKWEIALGQLDAALRWGVRKLPVLVDAGYGDVTEFREALTRRGLPYVAQVAGCPRFWLPGGAPGEEHYLPGDEPLSLEEIASLIGRSHYRPVGWREGSRGKQRSNFATLRVRCAHGHRRGRTPGMEEWLLCEWPEEAEVPTKFWLSTLPATTPRKDLVRLAKLRWRVERDYQELKGEVGLDHFEGRTWRGFHHHATLCAVAHGFLALHRALSPPIHPSMDSVHGPASLAAGAHPPTRFVPYVPPSDSNACPTERPLSYLIT
jgi:SRSO17 transposase